MRKNVSASTQNQALSALLFLYSRVLGQPPGRLEGIVRAKRPKRLPVVLTVEEIGVLLACVSRPQLALVCNLLYGSGVRPIEGLRVRVKDLEFARCEFVVRDGKGRVDRVTMLPESLHAPLRQHLCGVRRQWEVDLATGLGRAALPDALARKYPNADHEWPWQLVFPASSYYTDRRTGIRHRHHLHETVIEKAVRAAALKAGRPRPCISSHTS